MGDDEGASFDCNICFHLAQQPVVTLCGHLYCWACLYRWLQVQRDSRVCPVCKAGVEEDKVVPIYGRGSDSADPRAAASQTSGAGAQPGAGAQAEAAVPVPSRPAGQRPEPVQRLRPRGVPSHLGWLPAFLGRHPFTGHGGASEPLTPEQQHQAFLSRLLLMLGSFVLMCLLLF